MKKRRVFTLGPYLVGLRHDVAVLFDESEECRRQGINDFIDAVAKSLHRHPSRDQPLVIVSFYVVVVVITIHANRERRFVHLAFQLHKSSLCARDRLGHYRTQFAS
jgi:hypothetical protein